MLVTFRFKDKDTLHCDSLENLSYKIENDELAIYKGEEFLGYCCQVIGIPEEEFINYLEGYFSEIII